MQFTCDHIQHVFMWLSTVALLAGSKVKASFSQSICGQDNLCESLIRGVADPPTKSQVVKAKIGHGQFWMVKILWSESWVELHSP